MIGKGTDGDKPPPLKIHRQRGPRIKSNNPAVRRNAALHHVETRNKNRMIELCRFIIARVQTVGIVSADDCCEFSDGEKRRTFIGAAFSSLRKAGVIAPAGWQPSKLPRNHCRPLLHWTLADPNTARQWLADHPAPLPPKPPVQLTLGMEA